MNKFLSLNIFGFIKSKYILLFVFAWAFSCCKSDHQQSQEEREIELFLREVNTFSNIGEIPVYVSGVQSNIHYEKTTVKEENSVNYRSQDVIVRIFGDEQNAESNEVISYKVWNKSLAQKIRNKKELIGMSAKERAEYIDRMALKSNLMISNNKIIISEGDNSNSWICLVDENGKLDGRVWSRDLDRTKQFVGETTEQIPDIRQLSSILADKEIFE